MTASYRNKAVQLIGNTMVHDMNLSQGQGIPFSFHDNIFFIRVGKDHVSNEC